MKFRPEPSLPRPAADASPTGPTASPAASPAAERVGVLLVNLGTPEAPTVAATRRFLGEFLSDPRVVELPALLWKPILHGVVLRVRPARSAAKYQSIWMQEGSPLMVWSQRQASLLRGYLGERGHQVSVRLAMRYGQPSIAGELDALKARGCTRVLVVPMYPQYSGSTTGSVMDAVGAWMRTVRVLPEMRFVRGFAAQPAYIAALAARARAYWQANGQPGHVVMSFHGVPERMVQQGDPYRAECSATAQALAAELGLRDGGWTLAFQSRFGLAKWIGPATDEVLVELGRKGTARVDVMCPAFIADCLETLEEIAIDGKEEFQHAGGGEYHYIPCLNDHPQWMAALAQMVIGHIQGWRDSDAQDAAGAEAGDAAVQGAAPDGAPDAASKEWDNWY